MNNDPNDTQLENLLRGIAPAEASPALVQRVDEELKLDMSWLSTSRRKSRHLPRWLMSAGWAATGAAAAIAVMSYLPQQPNIQGIAAATSSAAAPVELPGSTIREWDGSNVSGMRSSRNRMEEKRALVVSRELQTWVDPRYDPQLTMEMPSPQFLRTSYK